MTITFGKPEKPSVYFKAWIAGDAGSGKSWAAVHFGKGLAQGGKVAVACTELEGTAFVQGEFDQFNWPAPYTTQAAAGIIRTAVEQGYKVLIFDSGSSLFEDDGGLLDQVERNAQANKRNYAAVADWKAPKQASKEFWRDVVLPAPIHILFTIRAEESIVLVGKTDRGQEDWRKTRKLATDKKRRFDVHTTFLLAPEGDGMPGEAEPHSVSFLKDRIGLKAKLGVPRYLDEAYGAKVAALLSAEGAPSTPGKATTTVETYIIGVKPGTKNHWLEGDNLWLTMTNEKADELLPSRDMTGAYLRAVGVKLKPHEGKDVYEVSKIEVL